MEGFHAGVGGVWIKKGGFPEFLTRSHISTKALSWIWSCASTGGTERFWSRGWVIPGRIVSERRLILGRA